MSSASGTHRLGLGETGPGASPARPSRTQARRPRATRPLGAKVALPEPPLVDERSGIRLRPWTTATSDVDALVEAWADPAIAAANGVPANPSADAAARWLAGDPARLAAGRSLDLVVAPLDDARTDHPRTDDGRTDHDRGAPPDAGAAVLGEVGLRNIDRVRRRAEISWWVAVDHRRRGLAAAATRLLAGWALCEAGGGLVQVWARIDPHNRASGRVAAAAGFVELGRADGTSVWARSAIVG